MRLFPTKYTNAADLPTWETTVEVGMRTTLARLCGGQFRTEVLEFLAPSTPLDPDTANSYGFTITDEDGSSASGSDSLRIEHAR